MKRREEIKELLKYRGEITLKELEEKFPESSGVTLRRDLKFLEEQGALKRTHGGAVARSRIPASVRKIRFPWKRKTYIRAAQPSVWMKSAKSHKRLLII